jgi:glycerol kinase
VVQWLRDGLGIIDSADQTESMAEAADDTQSVVIVPAFTGLGAPYWDADCRGAIYGLTRNSGPKELAKAALQSVAFQTRDLLEAMRKDWDWGTDTVLRVDGGMTASDWTMQYLADQLNAPVDRPQVTETTAKGAAYLAGLAVGIYPEPDEFKKGWQLEKRFEPSLDEEVRQKDYGQWQDAVQRTLSHQR